MDFSLHLFAGTSGLLNPSRGFRQDSIYLPTFHYHSFTSMTAFSLASQTSMPCRATTTPSKHVGHLHLLGRTSIHTVAFFTCCVVFLVGCEAIVPRAWFASFVLAPPTTFCLACRLQTLVTLPAWLYEQRDNPLRAHARFAHAHAGGSPVPTATDKRARAYRTVPGERIPSPYQRSISDVSTDQYYYLTFQFWLCLGLPVLLTTPGLPHYHSAGGLGRVVWTT